jgi:hypothetical protein
VLEGKRRDAERALRDIETTAGIEASADEALISDVVSEVADAAFDEMRAAQIKAAEAEAKFLTLKASIRGRKWHRLAERLSTKYNEPQPFWGEMRHPDWDGFISALGHDAHAPVPVAPVPVQP